MHDHIEWCNEIANPKGQQFFLPRGEALMDEKLSPAIDHYLHGRLKLLYLLAYLLEPFIWCSTYRARRENLYKFTSKNNDKSVKIFAPRRVDEQASDDKANERNGSNGKGNAHSI